MNGETDRAPGTGGGVGLFRLFAFLSVGAVAVLLVLVGMGLRVVLMRGTADQARAEAERITRVLREQGKGSGALVYLSVERLSPLEMEQERAFADLLRPFMNEFGVLRVRVFDSSRELVFTTDRSPIGLQEAFLPELESSLRGEPARLMGEAKEIWRIEGESPYKATLVMSYVPLMNSKNHLVGSMEVCKEVTAQVAAANTVLQQGMAVLGVALAVVFGGLTLVMRRAQREIERHAGALAEARLRERERAVVEEARERLRASERLASIGALAAGVGHDLNNLLLPMRGELRALRMARLSGEVGRSVSALAESVEYLRQLGDNLRLLAADPSEGDRGEVGVVRAAAWWGQVGGLLSRAARPPARVEAEISEELPGVCVAPGRLTQAMLNLIGNASDALQEGEPREEGAVVRVTAREASLSDGRRAVAFCVEDNGPGMTAEVMRHAFDPFFTTKPRGASTGLGLALVKGVATSAGGEALIESERGRGTRVCLVLPAAEERGSLRDRVGSVRERGVVVAVSLSDRRAAAYAGAMLAGAGFHVVSASDGEPGDAGVWLTDATEEALARARRFVGEGVRGRMVLVCGEAGAEWEEIGAARVGGVIDSETLGAALRGVGRETEANAT
ncbi:MAG: sensor histidine kinase [Phycisphaerales bacterium]